MDLLGSLAAVVVVGFLGLGAGRGREDPRLRRRWDSAFESERRRVRETDATGALLCRSCGASGSERAGRCPACGAAL